MSGYFKVPMQAVQAIVASTDNADLLSAYLVMRRFAYGKDRASTAAGARAIMRALGCTDWRSKRLLNDLFDFRIGDRALLVRTSRMKLNAPIHLLVEHEGDQAYLPTLLLDKALARVRGEDDQPETIRDAILLLTHLYALTDYAGWMGAPPDVFMHQKWDTDGSRVVGDSDVELGFSGAHTNLAVWAVSPPQEETWHQPGRVPSDAFGSSCKGQVQRVWKALWFLLRTEVVCKVAVVSDGKSNYPLWVFSPAYRSTLLEKHGIHGDLANDMYRLAGDLGADPDNRIIAAATERDNTEGTGLYFCCSRQRPTIRTVILPRLHAPTPMNLDGLREQAEVTQQWKRRVKSERVDYRKSA